MKPRHRLFQRPWGTFYVEDLETRKQESLRTRDRLEAQRLVQALNEAAQLPAFSRRLARVYWQAGDPAVNDRTWQRVMEEIPGLKQGPTRERWLHAIRDRAFDPIRGRALLGTRPEHLLAVLAGGTTSTNLFLRRIHNFALDMDWLPWPILPRKRWPTPRFKAKRAITPEEHARILAHEANPEWTAYYSLLWQTGGSQTDVATLKAEDIDWPAQVLSYARGKTGTIVLFRLDEATLSLLRTLPDNGLLFPMIGRWTEKDRSKAFIRRCRLASVSGVSLHSYRYAWAERAKRAGYPERFAQEALGHKSLAVHRAYARQARVVVPSLADYELAAAAIAPLPVATSG
jgi:hypothetical protein